MRPLFIRSTGCTWPIHKTTAILPVSQELLDDAEAMQRSMILSANPMMGAARLDYWMDRGGWSAFAAFKMRLFIDARY